MAGLGHVRAQSASKQREKGGPTRIEEEASSRGMRAGGQGGDHFRSQLIKDKPVQHDCTCAHEGVLDVASNLLRGELVQKRPGAKIVAATERVGARGSLDQHEARQCMEEDFVISIFCQGQVLPDSLVLQLEVSTIIL